MVEDKATAELAPALEGARRAGFPPALLVSALHQAHALHLHALQCSDLNSSEHHGWHCSSRESPAIVEVHEQKEHDLHLHSLQWSLCEQKPSQSANELSPGCDELHVASPPTLLPPPPTGAAAPAAGRATSAPPIPPAPLEVAAAAHHVHPLHLHQPQCEPASSGSHQPKHPGLVESSGWLLEHVSCWDAPEPNRVRRTRQARSEARLILYIYGTTH